MKRKKVGETEKENEEDDLPFSGHQWLDVLHA